MGELVSQSGDYVFAIALPWLVLLKTHSAFYVSLTVAVSWVPLLFSSVPGVYVDRINRRTSVILGNLVQGAASLTIATLYAVGVLSMPVLLALVFVLFFFDQFVSTAIDAMLPGMVQRKEELGAVNALFSISSSTNRIAGYIVGGAVVALVGVAAPILYDGTTFLFAALVTLTLVSAVYGRVRGGPKGVTTNSDRKGFKGDLVEGVRFVKKSRLLVELVVVLFVFNFFSGGTSALIAPYVADSLHLGSLGFGVIVSAIGAGGIIGSYAFGKINVRGYVGRLFFAMALLIAVATMVLGLVPSLYLALSMFFVFGLAGALVNLPVTTLIQAKVPNEMLGRVFAVITTIGNGATGPLAAVVAGSIAIAVSTRAVFTYFGVGLVLTVVLSYASSRELRAASY